MIHRASRITARQRTIIFKCFCLDQTAFAAGSLAKVNRNTADLWYRHYREKIYAHLRKAPRLYGEVEMDQKAFGGRGRKRMEALLKRYAKTMPRAQYLARAKEIRAEHKTQVFGMLQREGDVYVRIIKSAGKSTLMPLIRLVVEPGTTIYTDSWRGFADLGIDGYTHHSVNHSIEYSDRAGKHINGMESFWSFAHRRLQKFNGISAHVLPLHLKECEFRFNHRDDLAVALKSILH